MTLIVITVIKYEQFYQEGNQAFVMQHGKQKKTKGVISVHPNLIQIINSQFKTVQFKLFI